jgi:hypothetical protein
MFANANKKFIRSGAIPGDLKNYDAGQVFISNVDCSNSPVAFPYAIGKIWIHYDVELFVPILPQPYSPMSAVLFRLATSTTCSGATATDLPLQLIYPGYNLGIVPQGGSSSSMTGFTIPVGTYLAIATVDYTDTASEAPISKLSLFNSTQSIFIQLSNASYGVVANGVNTLSGSVSFVSNGTDVYELILNITNSISGTYTVTTNSTLTITSL